MGKIFIDDGHSFDYKNGQFMYRTFTFTTNTLIGRYVDLIYLIKFTNYLSLSLSSSVIVIPLVYTSLSHGWRRSL